MDESTTVTTYVFLNKKQASRVHLEIVNERRYERDVNSNRTNPGHILGAWRRPSGKVRLDHRSPSSVIPRPCSLDYLLSSGIQGYGSHFAILDEIEDAPNVIFKAQLPAFQSKGIPELPAAC